MVSTSAGNYNSLWESTVTGPTTVAPGQLTVIASLPAGITSITNPAAPFLPGTVQETDNAFRIRRVAELAAAGSDSIGAVRAAVLEVANVINAQVYENTGDVTDADGRPPHSMEVVVWDAPAGSPLANNNKIAQAMWDNKPGGIQYYSATGDNGNATDSQGNNQNMVFSRVTEKKVYVSITVTGRGLGTVTSAAVQQSIINWSNDLQPGSSANGPYALAPGSTVIRSQVMSSPLITGFFPVQDCIDVTACTLGFTTGPTGAVNLTTTVRQFPNLNPNGGGNIVVTVNSP